MLQHWQNTQTMGDIFGIGTAVSGIASTIGNAISVNKTNKFKKEESELAYQRAIQMRDNERDYTRPEEQMARLKSAGLNPHLMYGQGSTATGDAGQTPTYEPADRDPISIRGIPESLNQAVQQNINRSELANHQKTVQLMEDRQFFQNLYTESQTNQANVNTELAKVQLGFDKDAVQTRLNILEAERQNKLQDLENKRSQKLFTDAQTTSINKKTSWIDTINQANLENIITNTAKSNSQININQKQVHKMGLEMHNLLKDSQVKSALITLQKAKTGQTVSDTELKKAQKIYQDLENKTAQALGTNVSGIAGTVLSTLIAQLDNLENFSNYNK